MSGANLAQRYSAIFGKWWDGKVVYSNGKMGGNIGLEV